MSEDGNQVRYVYRLAPGPYYDVEAMESWLTDMAQEGLLLSKDGFFADIATFERSSPQNMKYRLEAAPKGTSIWSDNGGEPDEEAVAISQKYGWEYIAKRGSFYVYRSAEPGAREMNTDPEVQAMALNIIRKKELSAVLSSLFRMCLFPLLLMRGGLFLIMINIRTWYFLFGAALILWLFAESVARALHLGKLRKKLLTEGMIEHHKDWRNQAVRYRLGNAILGVLIVIWLGVLLHGWSVSTMDQDKLRLADYTGTPPFATMAGFVPDGEYGRRNFGLANTVKEWSDWLAPHSVAWKEIATIKRPDGTDLAGSLYVDSLALH